MARGKGTGRGGDREGTPGKVYGPNRADLNDKSAPPVNFEGGYGTDAAQAPLQAARTAPTTPGGEVAPAEYTPAPRPVTPLDAPDDQPWRPVTDGLPSGRGAGPETSDEWARLREYLPILEILASRPGASMAARNLVRRARGSLQG